MTLQRRRRLLCSCIGLSIVAFFLVITLGAYKISHEVDMPPHLKMFSNGTAQFAPTTILISLDGFRADFLKRGITPTLNQFISEGISPRFMLPSFPSVTFPNHYTLVTGLYPESHGVVGNTFWDPDMKKEFYYTDPNRSMQPYWWSQGQPLWVTAEEQKVTAAVHMWPGSEAGMEFGASYVDKFNGTEALARKTRRIMEFVDIPFTEDAQTTRPQLIAAYVPNVDSDGHKFGPNSTEIWDTISAVDSMLHDIFIGLEERNLTEIVNVVVVSDHGMATTSTERTVQVEDFVDLDLVEHIDGWPHWGLRPKNPADLQTIHDQIVERKGDDSAFDVYLRDENMPERYHFSNNDRIAPLWMIPKTGWAIVKKEEFNVEQAKASGEVYHPKGIHGYDHEHPLMRAIFVARGPAFPHKPNSRVENFRMSFHQFSVILLANKEIENTEVYNIVCDSLGIKPKANNGTLRLPLKPVGLHSDISDPETPADPPSPSSTADFEQGPEDEQTMGHTSESESNDSQASDENESTKAYNNYWAYMKAKMKAAMAWANKVISGLKKSNKSVGGNDQDS